MDGGLLAAIALGALVQAASGLGFALVAAPALALAVPGPGGIGLVNALAALLNLLILARARSRIRRDILASIAPALLSGIAVGLFCAGRVPDGLRPALVAASTLLSLAWLAAPAFTRRAGPAPVVWGGAINVIAGVGGPPIASALIARIPEPAAYLATLQAAFLAANLASLPALGVTLPGSPVALAVALAAGALAGEALRRRTSATGAHRMALAAIAASALVALARSLETLRTLS